MAARRDRRQTSSPVDFDADVDMFSMDEMRRYIRTLENQLTDLQEAQQQTQMRTGRSGGGTRRPSMQETHHMEDERDMYQRVILLENDLSAEKGKTREMLDQIAILESKLKKEMEEKQDYLQDKVMLQKKLDETKQLALQEKMRAEKASRVGEEAAQKGRAETGELVKLYEDNKRLAEENEMLRERVEVLEEESAELLDLVEHMREELTVKENEKEDALMDATRNQKQVADLRRQLDDTQAKLMEAHEAESRSEQQLERVRHEHASEKAKLLSDMDERKRDLDKTRRQVEVLHSETAAGEKAREVEALEAALRDERDLSAALQDKLMEAQESMSRLEGLVSELSQSAENREYALVLEEKKKTKEAELTVAALKAQVSEDVGRYGELEKEKNQLEVELQTAHNWMAMYEDKYDLTKAIAYSKVLQEDIKRRDAEIERMSLENGELMDEREYLLETCHRLKEAAGLAEDFWYSELDIKDTLTSDRQRMQGVIKELERQLEDMEADRVRLLKNMRDQAAQVSEKGIRYVGLDAEQMSQVNEFAKNLREGKVTLPLNDKSRELATEVKRLKDQSLLDRMVIARLESEQRGGGGSGVSSPNASSTKDKDRRGSEGGSWSSKALAELRDQLGAMRDENKDLKAQLGSIQEELHKGRPQDRSRVQDDVDLARFEEALQQALVLGKEVKELEQHNVDLKTKLAAAEAFALGLAEQASLCQWNEQLGEVQRSVADIAHTQQTLHAQLRGGHPGGRVGATAAASHIAAITGRTGVESGPGCGPQSEYGRELLSRLLTQLNLPPEQWADDVKELSCQLVCALEELSAREKELDEHHDLLRRYEGHLTLMRQQVSTLYREHLDYSSKTQDAEERLKKDNEQLRDQRTSLQIKVQRLEELVALQEACEQHPSELHAAAKDMARRLMAFEVNEARLARKYTILQEQLKGEAAARGRLEQDLADAEGTCKQRIAWLEEFKAGAVHRVESLEAELQEAVPKREYLLLAKELEMVRDDYLDLLQREASARIELLKRHEEQELLSRANERVLELEVNTTKLEANIRTLTGEVEHEKRLTDVAMADLAATTTDTGDSGSNLVHQVAQFRGEAARLDVELCAARKRGSLLSAKLSQSEANVRLLEQRLRDLQAKEADSRRDAQQARKDALDMETKYGQGGGLSALEAEELRGERKALLDERAALQRELERYKDMADIASTQVQALSLLRKDKEEALELLRKHCADLESRSDDDMIIGRLQRVLLSTKASYRAFARKHEIARLNLRRKETMARALEVRLDEREEALHRLHTHSRMQVGVLRKALQQLSTMGLGGEHAVAAAPHGAQQPSLFHRAKALSDRLLELAQLAEDREKEMKAGEGRVQRVREVVEGLEVDKAALMEHCHHLRLAARTKTETGVVLERELGRRLLALSEDLKATKLTLLQARRQCSQLRDEKRHLEVSLSKQQDVLALLEEDKVDKETASYTQGHQHGEHGVSLLELIFQPNDDSNPYLHHPIPSDRGVESGSAVLPEVEGLMKELEAAQGEVMELSTQAVAMRQDKQHLLARLDAVVMALQEYQTAVRFYESQAAQEKLPSFPITSATANVPLDDPAVDAQAAAGDRPPAGREEETQLQEAANATIGSLKRLIEEKNRIIERYEHKLAEARLLSRKEGAVNKAEIDRLTEKLFRKNEDAISQLKHAVAHLASTELTESGAYLSRRLMEQVEDATRIISDKDETLRQLELKLRTANNQRERAETRCGGALEEQERMRQDLVVLAQQLQEAEERALDALKGHRGDDAKSATMVTELRAALAAKETKLRGLRCAIVRLKEEFIRAQEQQAVRQDKTQAQQDDRAQARQAEMHDQMRALREQVESLQLGFAGAKAEIEAARKHKDKSAKARAVLEEENERLTTRMAEVEAKGRRVEEDLLRMRGDLNDKLRSEQRLKDKLKGLGGAGTGEGKEGEANSRLEELEKRVKVLTAQNVALRATLDTAPPGTGARVRPDNAESEAAPSPFHKQTEARVNSWETEKRLRRRVEVLEKRVEDKAHELEAVQGQATQAKELLTRSGKEKEALQKRVAALMKDSTHVREGVLGEVKRADVDKQRIFQLEEEVSRLRRKSEMEQAQRILTLTHQLEATQDRVKELEASMDSRDKDTREATSGRRLGGPLQEAEASYLREQTLQEEVEALKRERREAEARMLKKDADAIELRFDVEERNLEVGRLRRRLGELEAMARVKPLTPSGDTSNKTTAQDDQDRKGGGRFKRARDLEGVVQALKRVVEKLRAENERLRRAGGGEQGRLGDAKKVRELKTMVAEARDEIARLKARAASGEDASLKLAQKVETVNQLRKQLRVKDEAVRTWQQRCECIEVERDGLQKDLDRANLRVGSLEKDMIGLRAGRARSGEDGALVERLRHELAEQRDVIDTLRARAAASGGGGAGGAKGAGLAARERRELEGEIERLQEQVRHTGHKGAVGQRGLVEENRRLKEENAKLGQELQAFDLDFFEEIEDLKFKYHDAHSKLKAAQRHIQQLQDTAH